MRARFCRPDEIIASEPNAEARAVLEKDLGLSVTDENLSAAECAETVLIGVKPSFVLPVVREIAEVTKNLLVISLAAGVRVGSMEAVSNARLMRAMTNTPTAIGRGATAIAAGRRSTADDLARARKIFDAIGVTVQVNENQIDAVTALAGSGPAFTYTVIEAFAAGAVECGLPAEVAITLAAQTVLGAAELALTSGHSPEELRRMVITPGGTTAAGLAAMEERGASKALAAAVKAATARGREMAEESSR